MAHRKWLPVLCLLFSASAAPAVPTSQDCPDCSRMVVIHGGVFTMGSPDNEPERKKFEGPRNNVKVESFAIGTTEVTRGQYAVFVNETHRPLPTNGCFKFGFVDVLYSTDVSDKDIDRNASWRNPGFPQTDQHPVTCISWQDAKDYTEWLARKTGKAYRLPSEAEWEFAARAGTTSIFYWGGDENAACRYGNVGDATLLRTNRIVRGQVEKGVASGELALRFAKCDDGTPYTAPVGSHQPNAFGLYDMIGNVWEYVEDCWQESLPEDSRAHEEPSCAARRVRGGSWDDSPPELRSARRSRTKPDMARNDGGFRVARDLSPAEREPR
jgi:formylglycine-generating enzyme